MYNFFLCIQANSSSLKGFLSAVRLAHRGCDVEAPLLTFTPVKTSEFEKFKTKMVITSKKDYPLSKNFPYSLEHLQTSYCGLARVDIRMLSLKNLRKLDLSHNHIKKLPATIGDLIHLQELNLNDNHLESFSVALCQSTLQNSLRSLDRSNKVHVSSTLRFIKWFHSYLISLIAMCTFYSHFNISQILGLISKSICLVSVKKVLFTQKFSTSLIVTHDMLKSRR